MDRFLRCPNAAGFDNFLHDSRVINVCHVPPLICLDIDADLYEALN